MGERPVPDIVEKGGGIHKSPLIVTQPKPSAGDICKEHRAKRVLEPGMVCTRVDKVRKTELLDIPETLQQGCIEQRKGKILNLYVPVHRVLDDLHKLTKESSCTSHKSIE
jgi:hypothetical protein